MHVPSISSSPSSAHFASRLPDVDSWHKRLGHCGTRTIVDMARSHAVEGMPINLSPVPPKCEPCILGKQTRTSVPKMREGLRATLPLERVYVDLCGPMSVPSRTSRVYSMNVIDDFSSFVWSLPLRSKSEASTILKHWLTAVELHTSFKLKYLVTDNGELTTAEIQAFCADRGVLHLFTAPYTSAHNGRAERLHRTLMDKARAMRIACGAPLNMWEEFCATAAHLTNLTGASANNGKTPYELWHSKIPSLSHLREIGCRAYALVATHNPKLFHRSVPCILIGYARDSKAYRLWDPTTDRIFNSFHVSFIEHRELPPPPESLPVPPPLPPSHPPETRLHHSPVIANTVNIPISLPPAPPHNVPPQNSIPLQNTVPLQSSVPLQNNTVPLQSPVPLQNDPIPLQNNRNSLPSNDDPPQHNTIPLQSTVPLQPSSLPIPPLAPSRIPVPAVPTSAPRRSARIAALRTGLTSEPTANVADVHYDAQDYSAAFLTEFAPLRDTHFLLPLELDMSSSCSSVGEALSALAVGATDIELDPDDDPLWASALASPEREYWVAGARDELRSLKDLQVFVLVPRSDIPRGQRPLKGKLVCKRKRDDAGNISRYKVRYVVKGFAQRYQIDYDKTTAPTARLESFRALMHVAAALDWDIQHFDIKTAFLHGVLPDTETVFMEQPPGFEETGKEDWVWRLQKSLYGMKQASRIWNQTFHKTIVQLGFERLPNEWCVYRRQTTTGTTIFAVHVDDIISISSSCSENDLFKAELQNHWDISDLGTAKFALGISISRDRPSRTIRLAQTALIDRLVDQFGQTSAHPVDTPMVLGTQITRPDPTVPVPSNISTWMENTPYRSLVGTLNYLAVATRPDISYAVGRLASVLDCYRPEHWTAAIRVVRYLKGTRLHCLELGGDNPIRPLIFSDSDYANCPESSRSVGGYCFTLGSGMVSWASRKQQHTADSTCYAEYIAIHSASHEVLFFRQFLDGLHMPVLAATPLYCDNQAARQLTEDQRWHAKIKHFRVRYHSIRELVDNDELLVHGVRSSNNVADILTKPLGPTDFARLRHYLGIRSARVA